VVRARQAELSKAQTILSALDRALMSNQAALESLRTRLPGREAMGGFLSRLDRLASQYRVELRSIQPGAPVREELCIRTPVRFACQGAFVDLHALVYNLEVMDRLVRIDSLNISSETGEESCRMDVACSVYGSRDE
jgi:Tfp pilus assembly protein PilO